MKKLFSLILALIFCMGCESGGDETKTSNGTMLATVEEQMNAISQSLPKIKAAVSSLSDFVESAEQNASVVVTRGNSDDDKIHGVKEYIAALEERIETLENYITNGGEYADWLGTTFATLEMYEETISLLTAVQAEVESLKEQMSASNKALLYEADGKIDKALDSMRDWVYEELSGYYDMAATDALLAQLESTLTDSDAEIKSEIVALRENLQESLADMKSDYEDAIAEAIGENNGVITKALQEEIDKVNDRINDEIDALNKRLDDIEKRLGELESTVADLVKRIQSITYMPRYEDNIARITCPKADMTDSRLQLDFMISPKDAVVDLAKAYQDVIRVSALYTGLTNFVDMPVVNCSTNSEQGILTITAAGDNLDADFYHQKKNYKVFMSISDGNNDRNSEYIAITPVYQSTEATNSQITYTTSDNLQLSLSKTSGFGATLLDHYYRDGQGVMIFDGDVCSIGASAFKDCRTLTSITIPDRVTSIGNNAFAGCVSLANITIPDSVHSIGSESFRGSGLTSVTIPDRVVSIGNNAFAGCVSLANITIPDSVHSIGSESFRGSGLTSVTIPDGVTSIGECAFADCSSMREFSGKFASEDNRCLIIEGKLKAFAPADLTSYVIPKDIITIGSYVFSGCSSLTSLTILDSVTEIGNYAFSGCSGELIVNSKIIETDYSSQNYPYSTWLYGAKFTQIVIGDNITSIGNSVFNNYSSLTSVIISDTVTSIEGNAFRGCTSLTSVTIGDGVRTIGDYAFLDCTSLINVTIPDSVTEIGDSAFSRCSGLTSTTIGDGVTVIGEQAFSGCSGELIVNSKIVEKDYARHSSWLSKANFVKVVIGDNITSIGDYAFYGCSSLTAITIPNSVTSIGDFAFGDCNNLTRVNIADIAAWCGISFGYSCSNPLSYAHNIYLNGELVTDLVIPDSVTEIGDSAFLDCTSLTSVTIPDRVTEIGDSAFMDCTSLTSVTIGDGVTSIGFFAFSGCNSLTSITIPDSVTTIGQGAFFNCNSLTSITIPDSVIKIEEHAFGGCSSLTSITILDSVTSIGNHMFSDCTSLTSVTIGDGVTSIGDFAFSGCNSLTSITIPDSVTEIGQSAFARCSSLTSITIPDSVTEIGYSAFGDCSSLKDVYCQVITPPDIWNVFYNNASGRKIYVPSESVNAYKTAYGWSVYADDIVGYDFE